MKSSLKGKTTDGLKRELGHVYHFNCRLVLPKNDPVLTTEMIGSGDEWTKSVKFVKGVSRFIVNDALSSFVLPPEARQHAKTIIESLLKHQKCEIKFNNGRWLQLWIAREPVITYWPPEQTNLRRIIQ